MFEIGRDVELNYSERATDCRRFRKKKKKTKNKKSVGRANASVCTHATCDDTDCL